eukprot:TRINITY_DN106905_c0_g1_i1.p1 TRINITY_DN106905_c0_g1~~TRINITY_DN106905_c0_g1_i1.p1  ORF type:complete len:420 (+),score=63.47 TRINITY_DN106905_c0_g1_i1:3-1262(+)
MPYWSQPSKNRAPRACCAVIRHAERQDRAEKSWDPLVDMPAGCSFSLDPPLTSDGEASVAGQAKRLMDQVQPLEFHVVVTSPYMRCVQTAVQLCRCIGPQVRLLIDDEMGEIYGPSTMGDDKPTELLRPVEEIKSYCESQGVQIGSRRLGSWPSWPETVPSARLRFAKRFLQYLHRCQVTCRNFILVTHGDAVASALTTMPFLEGRPILKVHFGGFFFAQTVWATKELPQQQEDDILDNLEDRPEDLSWVPGGWQLDFSGIEVAATTGQMAVMSRLSTWSTKTGYCERRILELLGFRRRRSASIHKKQTAPYPDAAESAEQSLLITSLHSQTGASPVSSIGTSTAYFGAGSTPTLLDLGLTPIDHIPYLECKPGANPPGDQHLSHTNGGCSNDWERQVTPLDEAKPSFWLRRENSRLSL